MGECLFKIKAATESDVPLLLSLIKELAEYERLSHEVVATETDVHEALFSDRAVAEAIVGEYGGLPVGFALYFRNFSTFLGKPGIYLEDLYVKEEHRGKGFGHRLLVHLARLAGESGCQRLEWAVLNWNELAIKTYRRIKAVPMDHWTVYRLAGEDLKRLADENVDL